METNKNIYKVEDHETGNYCIYVGDSLDEARSYIIEDEAPELWDLLKNGNRIWCGTTETVNELKLL